MGKKYVPGEYITKALKGGRQGTSSSSPSSSKATNNSGYIPGEYTRKRLAENKTLTQYGLDSFGLETINDDIATASKLANTTYSGWQSKETLTKNRSSIQGVQKRLKAYRTYLKEIGDEQFKEIDNIIKHFDNILGGWNNVANTYNNYKNADEYNNEIKTLKELTSMSTDDILKRQSENPFGFQKTTFLSALNPNPAYTTVKGDVITWKDLYNSASARELKASVDVDKNGGFEKKNVKYSTYLISAGEGDVGYSMGVNISDKDKDAFLYNYINGDKEARDNGELLNVTMHGMWDGMQNRHFTEEEKKLFNAIWKTKGAEAAKKYLSSMDSELRMREIQAQYNFYSDMALESPVGASFASVVANARNNMMALPSLAIDLIEDGEVSPDSNLYDSRRMVQTVRGTVENDVLDSDLGKFAYRHGMSIADNITAQAMGGFGALGGASKAITVGTMSSGAGVDTVLDAKERGLSDEQALALGFVAATAEAAFESKSFDSLFDSKTFTDSRWKYLTKHIVTEVVGELGTERTNDIADLLIAQDLSKLNVEYESYLADGMSQKEAVKAVFKGVLTRYADVAAGAVLSAGAMAGPGAVVGSYQQNRYNTEMGQTLKANDRVGDVFDIANNSEFASTLEAYNKYAKKGVTAENVSDVQLGRLHTLASMEAQEIIDSKKSSVAQKESARSALDALETYASRNASSTLSNGQKGIIAKDKSDATSKHSSATKGIVETENSDMHKDADYVSSLVESGLESAEGTEAHTLATEYSQKLEQGKKVSAKEMVKLEKALDKQIRAEEVRAVKSYLKENGHDVALAEVVTRQARGEDITEAEAESIENSGIDMGAVEDAIVNYDGTEAKTAPSEVAETVTAESKEVTIPAEKVEELGLSPEAVNVIEQKAEGKEVTVDAIINNDDALNVLAENGNEELVNFVKQMKTEDVDKAKLFLSLYDGKTDVEAYATAFNAVAAKSIDGFTLSEVLNSKGVLTNAQAAKIYNGLRIARDKAIRKEYQKLSEKTAKMKAYKGVIDDSIIDYDNKSTEGKVNWNSLPEETRKAVVFFKGLAQVAGMNLTFVTDGKEKGFNGQYSVDGNTITIDLNAKYLNFETGDIIESIVPAMSHELTHWMEKKAPELYRKICNVVFPTLQKADGVTEYDRIETEITKLTNKGKFKETDSYSKKVEVARSEIIARACEGMLAQSKVGKEMFNALNKTEQKTLIEKVKDIVKDILNWINEALGIYKPTSYEAQMLMKYKAEYERLSKLWDKMLVESTEVNQALEKSNVYGHMEMRTTVEETNDLIAVHNASESQLIEALARGQLIMPSIAVTNKSHTSFGDISIVFRKDTINPENDVANKLYGADAWTPTQTQLKLNPKFDNAKTVDVVKDIKKSIGQNWSQIFDVNSTQFKETITSAKGSIYDAYAEHIGMQTAYAMKKGLITSMPTKKGKVDTVALKESLDEKLNKDEVWRDYKKWLSGMSDSIITSFDKASTEDIIENMKAQPDSAKTFNLSENGELTVPATEYNSIDEMRSNKNRLSENADEDAKAVGSEFLSWANDISMRTETDVKNVVKAINTSFANRYDVSQIANSFEENGITLSKADATSLQELYKKAVELPTLYFEAKPQRMVGFEEVAMVVVPDNVSNELKSLLAENNIPFMEYESGNTTDRIDALNSIEDVRFSPRDTVESIGSRDLSDFSEAVNTEGESLFNYRAMVEDEDIYRAMLLKHKDIIGITNKQINALFNTIDKAVGIIENNLEALDYAWEVDINDRAFSPVKPNSDSLYKVSLDFSTLCRKRLLQQTIAQTLQNALDKNLSTEESIAIRDELLKVQEEGRKIEVACALCYVESARMKSPKQINKFLNGREAIIKEFFANRSGGSIKEKIANAEMKARKALAKANPDGLIGKNDVVLDALTAPKSHMKKADADYIRNEGKKAKATYKLTEHEQAELDSALKMSVDDFTSAKGLENLAKNHPDLFDAYTSFVRNATHSKGIENDTWWRAGDSESIGDSLIAKMNEENGLRSQSWSDFQVIHLLDYIAATIELSTKGAKRQSYTKVPDYVKLLGNTGDMINMSLIPARVFNGKLEYDSVEGMAYDIAKQLRDEYHGTVGTICIGINNEQISMLLDDATIDMVIPYHHSSMSQAVRKLMHIPAWETYQNYQSEKKLSDAEAKARAKEYGVKLKKDSNYQKAPNFSEWFNLEEARQIAKLENANPTDMDAYKKYGKMYGGYMAMRNAANKYLKLCAERGLAPKFSSEKADFTHDANYWKLLTDRKMVDNVTGEIIEQRAIKPIFNEKHVLEILNDELARYPEVKADQEYATRVVTEKFLSGEMKVDKSTLEAIKKPVDNVTKVNIFESARDGEVLNSDRADTEYLELAKNPEQNAEKLQAMVDEAAVSKGAITNEDGGALLLYRGTEGGKTSFPVEEGHKGIVYTISNVNIASSYGDKAGKATEISKQQKGTPSTYALYCFAENILTIDARYGVAHDLIVPDELLKYSDGKYKATETEISEWAKTEGYDAVRVKDVRLVGMQVGEEVLVLKDNLLKSADLVTYDDDGNIIPLSERFNENDEDIRYSDRVDVGYHAGDLGKSEFLSQQGSYRDTGHFGTGTYFVGNKELVKDYNRRDGNPAPQHAVDFSKYNLYKVKNDKDGYDLHRQLQIIDGGIKEEWVKAAEKDAFSLYNSTEYYRIAEAKFGENNYLKDSSLIYGLKELAKKANIEISNEKQYSEDNRIPLDDEYFEAYYLDYLKESVKEELDKINDKYAKFRDAYFNLKLRFGFKGQVYNAMNKVLEYQKANPVESRHGQKKDSLATVFMKSLGYEGIDTRGTQLDNTAYGSVIYDLKEDSVLYSERADLDVYDLVGETERIRKENEKFKAEIDRLNERLKLERKVTHGNHFNENQLGAVAGHLRNISNSKIDKVELMKSLKDMYSFISQSENLAWEDVFERSYSIAEKMLSEVKSKTLVDEYKLQEQKRWLANEIYNQYWNVSPIRTTADKYDKQIKRLNFEHRQAMKEYRADYETRLAEKGLADDMYYGRKMSAQKEKYETSLAEQRARLADKSLADDMYYGRKLSAEKRKNEFLKQMQKALRERKDAEIASAKAHGREMMDKYKDNAERKTKIQSITSVSLSLNESLIKNSKDKHVPEIMKEPVTALLQAIDFSSKRMLKKGEPTKKDISLSKALGKVKDMMVKATNAHDELVELYGHGLDEDIEKMVDSVDNIMRSIGDNEFVLNAMSLEDLKTLDKMVKTIRHAVNKLNQFHTVNHAKGIASLSMESVEYLDSLGKGKVRDGLRGNTTKLLNWNNALPYYVFKRYGSGGMKVYEALMDGWDKFAFNTKQILDYANEAYTTKEVKKWGEEVKTFKILLPANELELANPDYVPQHQEVQLTVPQIMSMYCLNKREQARGHLLKGGIRVADFKTKKGEIISQAEGVVFTEADILTILDSLTDRQKAVADKLQLFMNTVSTDWGNEVSMARFGYKAFGEANYFPIQSDKNNLAVNDETEQNNSLFRLLNMSFTKSTVDDANNRIVISDIFDVFAQHTSDMAKYNALALPVLDAFKWYNFTEKEDIAEGTFKTKGVKQSIENAFGKDGQNYFTTFLKDINGQQEVSRDTFGKGFFTKAKIAAVGANLRVVALQPTSYARASAVIDNRYLAQALMHRPKIDKAEKYCGIALWKSMGYYDTNIQRGVEAQIKHAYTWKDKATEWSMKGAEVADKITWGYLWNACELEIRKTRKDLKVGSKEFYDTIGKRLREVIYATQVVDSTMTRSQMMRSSDGMDKALTAFASEPTLSYNMLQDAYMEYSLDKRRMGKAESIKKHGKHIGRILFAYTMTNAIAALVESAFDALRDDDDEEMDVAKFLEYYLKNFALDMSIGNKIPFVKEVYSIIQGFTSSRTETQWMGEMTKAFKGWYKFFNEGKGTPKTLVNYSLKAVSDLFGIPIYNAYRDTMASLNKLDIFTTDELNEMFEDFID